MIGMSGPSLRTECDDRRRLDRIDDCCEPRSQLAKNLERCESAIRQTEDVQLSHAEPIGGAGRLFGARGGELRSSRDVSEIANALGAVGGDHEVGLASLSRELRQERADDAFVIRMSEYCEDGSARLGRRRVRGSGDQRYGDGGRDENAHTINTACRTGDARHHTRRCRRQELGRPYRLGWPTSGSVRPRNASTGCWSSSILMLSIRL